MENEIKVKPVAIDAFSGAGGLSIGLRNAGFKIAYAFDIDVWSVESYNGYFRGNHCEVRDIISLKGEEILQKINLRIGDLDLFAGGPPCQGFSRQKKGAHNGDQRNDLVLEYGRIVDELQPKSFLLENVDMLGMKRGKEYIDSISKLLNNYTLYSHFYNSADYNLAQTRVRYITVGVRNDLNVIYDIPPKSNRRVTVGQVLNGLPEPPEDYSPHPSYFNHQRAKITKLNIERFSYVPEGGGWRHIPSELRLKCHQTVNTKKGGWPDVYGRLEWNGQCPTITGGFDSFTRGRYGHPKHNRAITAREAALIQGFPMDFEFKGNRGEVRKQIGNAVPPPLAKAIGKSIIELLTKYYQIELKSSDSKMKSEKALT